MSPVLLGLLGLNLANAGGRYYMGNKGLKAQSRLGRAQHQYEVSSAQRGMEQLEDDRARGRRQLLESLSSRGLGDSSVAENDLAYFDRGSQRAREGARERLQLAGKGLSAFKKGIRQQRLMNYLDLGMNLANSLGTAWMFSSMAPRPQVPPNVAGAALGPGAMFMR